MSARPTGYGEMDRVYDYLELRCHGSALIRVCAG